MGLNRQLSASLLLEALEVVGDADLSPADLLPGSNRKVLWRCISCQAQWTASVANRTAGRGCPSCAWEQRAISRATAPPGKSLADLHPEIAEEFSANLDRPDFIPGKLRPGSGQVCRWRCAACGQTWNSTVSNRVRRQGCPACANRARSAWHYAIREGQTTAAAAWPNLVGEFIENLTLPGRDLAAVAASSKCRCRWRCSVCGNEWESAIASRGPGRAGCPICANRRIAQARRMPPQGRSLADVRAEIANQFVENLTKPGRTPCEMHAKSGDICRWKCARGHYWTTTVAARSAGSGCPSCGSAGKSRLEFEVAEIVMASTALEVKLHQWAPITAGRRLSVDLCIPALSLWIDLDPVRWHKDVDRDCRKSLRLSHLDYLRLRPEGLPPVLGESVVVRGEEPLDWAHALAPALVARGTQWTLLGPYDLSAALARAAEDWAQLTAGRPSPSALDVVPKLATEFLENISRPGIEPGWLSPCAKDTCRWRCSACRHEWQSSVTSRAFLRSDCPACSRRRVDAATRKRAVAPTGKSIFDLMPELAAELIACLEDAALTPRLLRPSSNKKCQWRCRKCAHEWVTSPAARVRGRGCPACGREVIRRSRTMADPDKSLACLWPDIAIEFVDCSSETGRTPQDLLPMSNKCCTWRCTKCAFTWITTVASRVAGTGCPACGRIDSGNGRAKAPSGKSLADVFPELVIEFIEDCSRPGVLPKDIRAGSHDNVLWRCSSCGNQWTAVVKNRTRGGTGCPVCASLRRRARIARSG